MAFWLPGVLCYEKHKVSIVVYLSEYAGYTDSNKMSSKLVRNASCSGEKIDPHIQLKIQEHLCADTDWGRG